jgi:signal transduction histidine kinase
MIPFQLLDLILPFYVVYNTNGIVYASPNIIRIINFDNLIIELEKPFNAKLTFNFLKELKEMVLFFNISNKTFKGQVLEYEEYFLLIGTPLIHDPKDLENYKITLNDLPLHDSTGDFLFAIESNKILLQQAKESAFKLNESLAITKKLSENLAEEVEIKTEKYKIEKEHAENAVNELQALQSELLRVEKLSALGNLVSGIAHEINTPLAVIKTNHGLLQNNLRDLFKGSQMIISSLSAHEKEIFYEIIDKCLHNKEYLNHRQERHRRKLIEIQLSDYCEEQYIEDFAVSFSIIGLLPPYNLYFEVLSIPKFKTILKLAEVILRHRNSLALIDNAVEKVSRTIFSLKNYTDEKEEQKIFLSSSINKQFNHVLNIYENYIAGKILIEKNWIKEIGEIKISEEFINVWKIIIYNSIQVDSLFKKEIIINIEKEEKILKIEIHDNGKGITIENQDKIFTPFFTTKNSGEGIGLGLYTAKKIVENNHGTIDFFSDYTGTVFQIILQL